MTEIKAKAPLAHCNECPLRNHTFVPPSAVKSNIAIVGEAPGRTETIKGAPFVGPSGDLLWGSLSAVDIRREDAHVTNAVLCYPGHDDIPVAAIECCRDRLLAELNKSGAKFVLSLGREARTTLVDEDEAITMVRGRWIQHDGRWILPTLHPAYILKKPSGGVEYLRDVVKFSELSPRPFVPTNTLFWHYPDSKMRPWLTLNLKALRDKHEREWLQAYCEGQSIEWVESDRLLDNKIALREAASAMIEDVVIALNVLLRQERCIMAFDLETTGYLPYRDRILNLSLSWAKGKSMVISGGLLWQKSVKAALTELFESPNIIWIGHNGKFDVKFLISHLGTAPKLTHDTFILHCVLDERSQLMLHALKPLVSQYFDVPDYEAATIKRFLPSKKTSFANVPPQLLGEYAGMDTDYTRRLWFALMAELKDEPKTVELYQKLLMSAARAFVPIELHGIQIDWDRLDYVHEFLEGKERQVLERLRILTDNPTFNPNSPKQVKAVLWDEKEYEPPRVRGKVSLSTAKEVLGLLAAQHPEDEFLALLTDVRRYRKLMSSYVRNLHKFEDDTGRVHPVFNVTGTEVGRLSARDPAIQTIPRAYEPTGKLIRDFYIASSGYVLVHCDYSQAELRCAAMLSRDEFLLTVYREGRDLHTEVALSMYGKDFTKEQRNICKMFNFAYLYGGTAHSFAYDAGMDIKEGTAWVKRYNGLMTGLSVWKGTQFQLLQEQGYVESPSGRRRRFPLLMDRNVAEAKKAVVHAPCAGSASDLTLAALIETQRTVPEDVFPLVTVHDSNIVECPDDDGRIAETVEALKRTMKQSALDLFGDEIPFTTDAEVGYRWGSLLEYNGTPEWRQKVEHRPLFEQTEFLERMEHEVCEACGRWNPPRETRKAHETKCLTCKEELR